MFPNQIYVIIYKYLYSYFYSSDDFHIIQSVPSSNSFKVTASFVQMLCDYCRTTLYVIECEPLHDPNNRSVGFIVSRFIEPSSLQPPHRGEHAKGVRGEEGE